MGSTLASLFATVVVTVFATLPGFRDDGYTLPSVLSSWGVTTMFGVLTLFKALTDTPASQQDVADLRQGLAGMRQDSAEQSRQMLDAMQSMTAQISRLADRLPEPGSQGHDISGGDSQSGD